MKYKSQYFDINDDIFVSSVIAGMLPGKNRMKSAARKSLSSRRRTRNFRAFREYDEPVVPTFKVRERK